MIHLINIVKKFNPDTVNEISVFDGFPLSVKKGEFVSVVGSNGSGKTTMLNLLAGTLLPDSGSIFVDGKDVTGRKEYERAGRMGRVFQDPSKGVAGSMTLAENLALASNKGKPYNLRKGLKSGDLQKFKELVSPIGLGLEDKMQVKMHSLSGGQRQAVALLMATMTPVDVLILDEHTAALDPKTADLVMQLTDRIVREKQLTALMVTHNLRYAVEYGNRLIMMHGGWAVLDRTGEEKRNMRVDDVLGLFNAISVECGN